MTTMHLICLIQLRIQTHLPDGTDRLLDLAVELSSKPGPRGCMARPDDCQLAGSHCIPTPWRGTAVCFEGLRGGEGKRLDIDLAGLQGSD